MRGLFIKKFFFSLKELKKRKMSEMSLDNDISIMRVYGYCTDYSELMKTYEFKLYNPQTRTVEEMQETEKSYNLK